MPSDPHAIADGAEKVSVARTNETFEELIARRLSNFMLVTIVAGLSLCGALGYETIRMQYVIQVEHAAAVERTAQAARDRAAGCAYTKAFIAAFAKFEGNQAIELSLTPDQTAARTKARLYAFDTLFADLGSLGTRACAAP